MELTRRLLRFGYRRPHVLLAEAPGAADVRRAAEQRLDAQGWPRAASPAEADVLLVCGSPGPQLQEQLNRVWQQLPGPRARASVVAADQVAAALKKARTSLWDLDAQRADAGGRNADDGPGHADVAADPDMGEESDMGDPDAGWGHEMGGDSDTGDMSMPGGLPMASTGPDRDGLQLDVLHLQLGPVLPYWPAGLLAELAVQGDVVVTASLRLLDGAQGGSDDVPAAAQLDRAAATLSIAGAERYARRVRTLRSRVEQPDEAEADRSALHRAVSRDRLLRWSLVGLPAVGGGDLWQQLLALLGPLPQHISPVTLDEAAQALTGHELTAVRLALAAAPPLHAPERAIARA